MEIPTTRYVVSGDDHVAYQIVGDGPTDVILLREPTVGVDQIWDNPDSAYFHRRLAANRRLILFDSRGFGSSDRWGAGARPTWEIWTDDILALMDGVGSERATVVAMGMAGMIGLLYSGTHPDRVSSLVLVNSFARWFRDRDYPHGYPQELREKIRQTTVDNWGTLEFLRNWAPSLLDDPPAAAQFGRAQRLCLSPGQMLLTVDPNIDRDARPVLGAIRVPTLVMHRAANRIFPVDSGRYLAEHIADAEFVELPGADHHYCAGDVEPMLTALDDFLDRRPDRPSAGRVLATVLFTDIVGSTGHATALGDNRWRELLDRHDAIGKERVTAARGRLVASTGDGLLATFDGPARAIQCATALRDDLRDLAIDIRAGVHCAEVELRGRDIGGIGVHVANRILGLAGPGEVLVSRTVKDLVVGAAIELTDRGVHRLAGVAEEHQLFAVTG